MNYIKFFSSTLLALITSLNALADLSDEEAALFEKAGEKISASVVWDKKIKRINLTKQYQNNRMSSVIHKAFESAKLLNLDTAVDLSSSETWSCLKVSPLSDKKDEEEGVYLNFHWFDPGLNYQVDEVLKSFVYKFKPENSFGSICTEQMRESTQSESIESIITGMKGLEIADIRGELPNLNIDKIVLKQYSCTNRTADISKGQDEIKSNTKDNGIVVQLEACFKIR